MQGSCNYACSTFESIDMGEKTVKRDQWLSKPHSKRDNRDARQITVDAHVALWCNFIRWELEPVRARKPQLSPNRHTSKVKSTVSWCWMMWTR
jgi:hypothetical protein